MHLQNIHTINKLYSAVKYIFNVVDNMHIDQDIPAENNYRIGIPVSIFNFIDKFKKHYIRYIDKDISSVSLFQLSTFI